MTTSGTTSFTLDWDEILSQASALIGGEDVTGFEAQRAKVSLNLMLAEMASRGLNLWAFDRQIINTVAGTGIYYLPADTIDVLNVFFRQNPGQVTPRATRVVSDPFSTVNGSATITVTMADHGARSGDEVNFDPPVTLNGISIGGDYSVVSVTNSSTFTITGSSTASGTGSGGGTQTAVFQGYVQVPMQRVNRDDMVQQTQTSSNGTSYIWWLDKQIPEPQLNIYPMPDDELLQIGYWRKRRIQDVGSSTNTLEVPFYFLPAIVDGVAYYMARVRLQSITQPLRAELKEKYMESLKVAIDENRDPSPLRLLPDFSSYNRR